MSAHSPGVNVHWIKRCTVLYEIHHENSLWVMVMEPGSPLTCHVQARELGSSLVLTCGRAWDWELRMWRGRSCGVNIWLLNLGTGAPMPRAWEDSMRRGFTLCLSVLSGPSVNPMGDTHPQRWGGIFVTQLDDSNAISSRNALWHTRKWCVPDYMGIFSVQSSLI